MKTRNDKIDEFTERIIELCREYNDANSDEFVNRARRTIRAAVYYGQRIGANNKADKPIDETAKIKDRVKPTEIIELVRRLHDADKHIFEENGKYCITDEWLVGCLAGRSFEGDTLEEAAEKMIDYLYSNMNFNSLVGQDVKFSGFPDLKKVEEFCLNRKQN